MKLRIKGNSLRLRITPSEMAQLMEAGRIEEIIHFAADGNASLTYALEHSAHASATTARYSPGEIALTVPSGEARRWAASGDVGLYGKMQTSHGELALAIEKDFACLDKSDAENADTFPNPNQGTVC